jgi:hypothetical protein
MPYGLRWGLNPDLGDNIPACSPLNYGMAPFQKITSVSCYKHVDVIWVSVKALLLPKELQEWYQQFRNPIASRPIMTEVVAT